MITISKYYHTADEVKQNFGVSSDEKFCRITFVSKDVNLQIEVPGVNTRKRQTISLAC